MKFYAGEHQGIVSAELWDKVQQTIQKQTTQHNLQTEQCLSGSHLLRSLLRLETGEALSPSHTKGIRYYVCQKAIKHGFKSCELKSLNAALLEDIVLTYALDTVPQGVGQHIHIHYNKAKRDGCLSVVITLGDAHRFIASRRNFSAVRLQRRFETKHSRTSPS